MFLQTKNSIFKYLFKVDIERFKICFGLLGTLGFNVLMVLHAYLNDTDIISEMFVCFSFLLAALLGLQTFLLILYCRVEISIVYCNS